MINFIENSLFFGAALSLAGYEVGLLLKKKFKMALFNPLLIAILCVMGQRKPPVLRKVSEPLPV